MAVVKIIELVGSSEKSSDDAAGQALKQAQSSLRNIRAVDVVSTGRGARTSTSGGRTCESPSWSRAPTSTRRLGGEVAAGVDGASARRPTGFGTWRFQG